MVNKICIVLLVHFASAAFAADNVTENATLAAEKVTTESTILATEKTTEAQVSTTLAALVQESTTLTAIINDIVNEKCKDVECPTVPKHYEEMGCEGIKSHDDDCCASSFKCPDLTKLDNEKCYYKDEVLKTGEYLKSSKLGGMCSAACYCSKGRNGKRAELQCAHVDCPEFFGNHQPSESCIHQYDTRHCCSIGSVCDDEVKKLATCEYEGEEYREGQKIYPEDQCYECYCTKDFNSTVAVEKNQNCYKIDCGISLRNIGRIIEGCIPVYYKSDNCCPIGWRCPGDKHMQESETTGRHNDTSPKCKFGKMLFNVGESLDLDKEKCQKCTCKTPPMLHCIETC